MSSLSLFLLFLCLCLTAAVSIDKLKFARKIGRQTQAHKTISHQKTKIAAATFSKSKLFFRIQHKRPEGSDKDPWDISFDGNLELYDRVGKNDQRIGVLKLFQGDGHTVNDFIAEFMLSTVLADTAFNGWDTTEDQLPEAFADKDKAVGSGATHRCIATILNVMTTILDLERKEKQHGRHMTLLEICGLIADVEAVHTAFQNYRENGYNLDKYLEEMTEKMTKARFPNAKLSEVIGADYGGSDETYNIVSHYKFATGAAPEYVPIGHETIRYADWNSDFGFPAVWTEPQKISTELSTKNFVSGANQFTVRGDSRGPDEIFTWGFRPKRLSQLLDECLDEPESDGAIAKCKKLPNSKCKIDGEEIAAHLKDCDSCWWVSTSIATSVSLKFSTWLYLSIVRQSLDINKMSDGVNYEGEILVNGGVPSEDIYVGIKFTSTFPRECGMKGAGSEEKPKYDFCSKIEEIHYNNAFAWPETGGMATALEEATKEFFQF